MIFGFNTDVPLEGTVYHVQSEARVADLLLQTQVFVKGRCLGKRAASYAHLALLPEFTDEHMHELLKEQHRGVLEAVRQGVVEAVIAPDCDIEDVGGGLALRWLDPQPRFDGDLVRLAFGVSRRGDPVQGAAVSVEVQGFPERTEGTTDANGAVELSIVADSGPETSLLVQATAPGLSATRKFRLRR